MFSFRKGDDIPEVAVTVTNETFIRLAALSVGTIILLMAAKRASHALLLIFTAFFLALALNGPVHWLSEQIPGKRKGSRSLATSLSFLVVVLLLGGFIASIVPPLVKQTESFVDAAPVLIRDFRSQDSFTGRTIRKYHLQKQVNNFSTQLSERIKNSGGAAFSTLQKIGNSAFSLITILVLTFMMLVEGPRWLGFAREITPDRQRSRVDRLIQDMYRVIQGYVNGQVTLAALAAVLIMPAILILDISYPIALMVVVFICGLIPMVGHTIGAIIVTLVALFESTSAALIILTYYIVYQQLENILIQPRIQSNSTNMSPLLVFSSVVIGVSFGGLLGGLVAIPVAGCIRILVLEYLRTVNIISTSEYKKAIVGTK
jgi:predicted PurR-regulated permease PerM